MSARKPPGERQRRDTKDTVVKLVPGGLVVPDPSPGWLPVVGDEWSGFWADDQLRSLVRESQVPALRRLFDWRDKLHRAWAEAETLRQAVGGDHMVAGSMGQERANPLYELAGKAEARALQIEGRIEALEDRFGLTPGAMLKLGVDFQRQQSLQARNALISEAMAGDADPRRSAPDDPRALPGDAAVRSG